MGGVHGGGPWGRPQLLALDEPGGSEGTAALGGGSTSREAPIELSDDEDDEDLQRALRESVRESMWGEAPRSGSEDVEAGPSSSSE